MGSQTIAYVDFIQIMNFCECRSQWMRTGPRTNGNRFNKKSLFYYSTLTLSAYGYIINLVQFQSKSNYFQKRGLEFQKFTQYQTISEKNKTKHDNNESLSKDELFQTNNQ